MNLFLKNKGHKLGTGVVFLVLLLISFSAKAQLEEYKIKAALMIKIIPYFTWENANESEYFTIGILGENPFEDIFEKAYLENQFKINGKELQVKYLSKIGTETLPDILYVAPSEESDFETILSELSTKPVLIISDYDGLGERGSHINFFISNSKVRFELNEDALSQHKIKVDYRLRGIAKMVKTKQQ